MYQEIMDDKLHRRGKVFLSYKAKILYYGKVTFVGFVKKTLWALCLNHSGSFLP
jgi:hypothetical protein